ncbi:hypothetical protein ACFYM0_33375 [Streptomyces sp. NPDC006487]|uniref:hypothetical protein n=1 Tax=Streptomyces sp. NPDC006487 TaxID=3364748 RepID=UPI0036846CDB
MENIVQPNELWVTHLASGALDDSVIAWHRDMWLSHRGDLVSFRSWLNGHSVWAPDHPENWAGVAALCTQTSEVPAESILAAWVWRAAFLRLAHYSKSAEFFAYISDCDDEARAAYVVHSLELHKSQLKDCVPALTSHPHGFSELALTMNLNVLENLLARADEHHVTEPARGESGSTDSRNAVLEVGGPQIGHKKEVEAVENLLDSYVEAMKGQIPEAMDRGIAAQILAQALIGQITQKMTDTGVK